MSYLVPVLVHTPAYSRMARPFTYRSESALAPGILVRVPLGQRELLGVVWDDLTDPPGAVLDPAKLRPIAASLAAITPLTPAWRQLITFTANYHQRSLGEVALAALPPQLRDLSSVQLARRLKRQPAPARSDETRTSIISCPLSAEQEAVMARFDQTAGPFLLFGATGSGKTEVYLHCVGRLLAGSASAQAMVLVPEINLTPQLEDRFRTRFEALYGAHAVVALHSGMTPAQRLQNWLAAHSGVARTVLGTRMAVLALRPDLKLIIVDEEHDPSYKSAEGARYSARDLAVYRGRLEGAKVMLGSATPSLESWYHRRPLSAGGRYVRLEMPSRIGGNASSSATQTGRDCPGARPPQVRRVDMNHQPKHCVIAPPLLEAIAQRVARGEPSLVFSNRRGYAPVLHCADCDWKR